MSGGGDRAWVMRTGCLLGDQNVPERDTGAVCDLMNVSDAPVCGPQMMDFP